MTIKGETMTARDHYLDDFKPGDIFESPHGYTFTDADIIAFAHRYDPQVFHLDVEAAKKSIFGGLIASGFQTLAATFRLVHGIGFLTHNMGGPGMDELRWLRPVRPGDTLRAVAEIVEVTPSRSKRDRGALRYKVSAVNQKGETVMTALITSLVRRKG
jgi:acyl dehydratase